jgi:hypothetical protein
MSKKNNFNFIENYESSSIILWVFLFVIILMFVVAIGVTYYNQTTPEEKLIKKLKKQMDHFMYLLVREYPQDIRVQRLNKRYTHTQITISHIPETYTLNKKKIAICLHNYSEKKQIHDDFNLLMFVALHELSHVMSETIHHGEEFWDNFKFLLECAVRWKFYYPIDYSYNPVKYCNLVVYDNPYFEEKSRKDFFKKMVSFMGPQ